MICIKIVDGEADVDVLELLCLGLPILVARLPIDIIKVVHEICWSYEISAFDGEISLVEQQLGNSKVNLKNRKIFSLKMMGEHRLNSRFLHNNPTAE